MKSEDIEKVADLAQLKISSAEAGRLARELTVFLDYVSTIEPAECAAEAREGRSVHLRRDVAIDSGWDLLEVAPAVEGRELIVPRVLDEA